MKTASRPTDHSSAQPPLTSNCEGVFRGCSSLASVATPDAKRQMRCFADDLENADANQALHKRQFPSKLVQNDRVQMSVCRRELCVGWRQFRSQLVRNDRVQMLTASVRQRALCAGWRRFQSKLIHSYHVQMLTGAVRRRELRGAWAGLIRAGLLRRVQFHRERVAGMLSDRGRLQRGLRGARHFARQGLGGKHRAAVTRRCLTDRSFQLWSSRTRQQTIVRLCLQSARRCCIAAGCATWRRVSAEARRRREASALHSYLRRYGEYGPSASLSLPGSRRRGAQGEGVTIEGCRGGQVRAPCRDCRRAVSRWQEEAATLSRLRRNGRYDGQRILCRLLLRWREAASLQLLAQRMRSWAGARACVRALGQWADVWREASALQTYLRRGRSLRTARALVCWRDASALLTRRRFRIHLRRVVDCRVALSRWRDGSITRARFQRRQRAWARRALAIALAGWRWHLRRVRGLSQRRPLCTPDALAGFLWRSIVAAATRGFARLSHSCRSRRAAL